MRYSAFDETHYYSGITGTDYRYTGQLQQADINLYYYNARYYDPALGRFVQSDTMVPQPYSVQGYDRYAYVNNNPLRYTDPSGHWVESALDIAFIGYDIYDISTNGLNWENGLSLGADIAGLILPVVTGGGLLVKAAFHADDAVKAVNITDKLIDAGKAADHATEIMKTANNTVDVAKSFVNKAVAQVRELATTQSTKLGKGNGTGYTVYRSVVDGVTEYVGMTNNFARRRTEHLAIGRIIEPIPGLLNNLTKKEARAVEQTLIDTYKLTKNGGVLSNLINSISPKRVQYYQAAIIQGKNLLSKHSSSFWRKLQ